MCLSNYHFHHSLLFFSFLGGMAPPPTPIFAYRLKKWTMITTKDILPGDLISLAFKKRSNSPVQIKKMVVKKIENNTNNGEENGDEKEVEEEVEDLNLNVTSRDELVPCDCVLLRGAAVVNEASLTGEECSLEEQPNF